LARVRQSIMGTGCNGAELLTSWVARKQRQGRDRAQDIPFKATTPKTYFLQLVSISRSFYHLQIMPWKYESIHGLICGLGQSPHDPITYQWLQLAARNKTFGIWAFWGTLHTQIIIAKCLLVQMQMSGSHAPLIGSECLSWNPEICICTACLVFFLWGCWACK
jgi:hypothetical protein